MGLAANLGIATSTFATDLCQYQYINSDLVFSDLKFWPLCSEIATVKVVIPSIPYQYPLYLHHFQLILLLATTWSLYQA